MLKDKIKALCQEQKITIKSLEESCGLKHGTIKKWNKESSNPRVKGVLSVARELGTTVEYLLTENQT